MKKALFFLLTCLPITAFSQVLTKEEVESIVEEKGVLEQKRVVQVEGTTKNTLYRRAMEALSDWTGSEGRSKAGIDYSDKEEGIVNYKGEFYQGIYRKIRYTTDFTLKVRCKDGRAQITVIASSINAFMPDGRKRSWTMREALERSKNQKEKTADGVITTREVVHMILDAMDSALKKQEDDDF